MAKKKEEESKIVLERNYNVPLRRRWVNVPKYKRAKKAVTTLRVFLEKHMKPGTDEKGKFMLKLGKYLNDHIWKHGIKNPPHHVKIVAKKDDKGAVTAELEGAPVEKKEEKETKKEEKRTAKEEKKEKHSGKLTEDVKKVAKEKETEAAPAVSEKREGKSAETKAPAAGTQTTKESDSSPEKKEEKAGKK